MTCDLCFVPAGPVICFWCVGVEPFLSVGKKRPTWSGLAMV